MILLKT